MKFRYDLVGMVMSSLPTLLVCVFSLPPFSLSRIKTFVIFAWSSALTTKCFLLLLYLIASFLTVPFIYVFFFNVLCCVMMKNQLQNRHTKCSIGFSVRAGSTSWAWCSWNAVPKTALVCPFASCLQRQGGNSHTGGRFCMKPGAR